jgi:hypothetical protein
VKAAEMQARKPPYPSLAFTPEKAGYLDASGGYSDNLLINITEVASLVVTLRTNILEDWIHQSFVTLVLERRYFRSLVSLCICHS